MAEVFVNGLHGDFGDGDEALAIALAGDEDDADIAFDGIEGEGAGLAGAEAGGVEEFEEGTVAEVEGRG